MSLLRNHSLLLLSCLFCLGSVQQNFAEESTQLPQIESLHPRIESVTWYSQQLKKQKRFSVVFPNGYTSPNAKPNRNWPVLFLLHGRGRHDRSLIEDQEARAQLLQANFFIILPQGDDGWYIDSPHRKQDRYESYLTELITFSKSRYPLSKHPADRALAGWSMGGYGAMHYLVRHPDDFSAIVTLIGLIDFPREGLPSGQSYKVPLDRFGTDQNRWKFMNPIHGVKKLDQKSILLLTADKAFDRTMNENFAQQLQALKISHQFEMLEGGHTFSVVRSGLKKMIPFLNTHFSEIQ
ncbi:MAG: hypothetical protein KDA65_06075 [Planctomycetaceae bacterium]|nr:hypothetical protein [Planctomycetaceae bacterium]